MRKAAFVVAMIAALHAGIWLIIRQTGSAPAAGSAFWSLSFAPFNPVDKPDKGALTSEAQIRADLKVIAPFTHAIRTYASTGGLELVPKVANEFGLKVTAGAWIDKFKDRNEQEIENVIELAKHNRNVTAVVVGNETILRDEIKTGELIEYIQRVKREVSLLPPLILSPRTFFPTGKACPKNRRPIALLRFTKSFAPLSPARKW